jgi:crossover junction endodeoxyribonuclease RusA
MPPDADNWKMIIRTEGRRAWEASEAPCVPRPWSGPLVVNLTFYFPRPKKHFRSNGLLKDVVPYWHTSIPDRDNLDKAVLDALTQLCIWEDDCLVCDGRIRKLYVQPGGQMGCLIEIKECETAGR